MGVSYLFLAVVCNICLMSDIFHRFFCRVSSSEFIIPVNKFMKSLDCSYSVGMRFRMRFETEDSAERRSVDCHSCSCYIQMTDLFLIFV
jgi:hypothetical protein